MGKLALQVAASAHDDPTAHALLLRTTPDLAAHVTAARLALLHI